MQAGRSRCRAEVEHRRAHALRWLVFLGPIVGFFVLRIWLG